MGDKDIKDILLEIKIRLDEIEDRLERIERSTGNMDSHIGFVETVYEKVSSPFHSLMDFTDGYLGKTRIE